MFLGEGKRAHDHQSHQDKSGYDILHHGYHSRGLAHYVATARPKMMNTVAAVNAAGRPIEPVRPEAARRGKTKFDDDVRFTAFEPSAAS
jgi:hypothetical protein